MKFKKDIFAVGVIIITSDLVAKTKSQEINRHTETDSVSLLCNGKQVYKGIKLTAWFDHANKRYLTQDSEFKKMHCSVGFKAKKFNPRFGEWLSNIFYWSYDLKESFSGRHTQPVAVSKNLLPQAKAGNVPSPETSKDKDCERIGKNFANNTASTLGLERHSSIRMPLEQSELSYTQPKNSSNDPAKFIGTTVGITAGVSLVGYGLFKVFEPISESSEPPRRMDINAVRGKLDGIGVPINNVNHASMGMYSNDDPFPINSGIRLTTDQVNTDGIDRNGKIAVIVEPRPLEILVKVIRHAMDALSDDWKFQVFHGYNNKLFLETHFKEEIAAEKLILTNMHCQNLNVKIYNNLMLDPNFWNHVLGETVLMFEIDSTVCGSESSIEPFLEYDYVGAPWANPDWYNQSVYEKGGKRFLFVDSFLPINKNKLRWAGYKFIKNLTVRVGNSGFSLRKRSKMLAILDQYRPGNYNMVNRSYDFYLAGAFLDAGYAIPDVDTASGFSVEGIMGEKPPFGTHKPWEYLSTQQIYNLGIMCKNLNTLKSYYADEKNVKWGKHVPIPH